MPSFPPLAAYAGAYAPLSDPGGPSVLLAAVSWLEGTMLGTLATTAALLATAGVGFMMLSGRIDARRGMAVVLGAFILFGASSIVAGLQASLDRAPPALAEAPSPPPPPPAAAPPAAPAAAADDPYAGAAIP